METLRVLCIHSIAMHLKIVNMLNFWVLIKGCVAIFNAYANSRCFLSRVFTKITGKSEINLSFSLPPTHAIASISLHVLLHAGCRGLSYDKAHACYAESTINIWQKNLSSSEDKLQVTTIVVAIKHVQVSEQGYL